jgi:hypothetical protein
MKILKLMLAIVAALCVIVGLIWVFQGINILPGSFMTGHMEWAYRGAALAVVGALLFWLSRRK